MRTIIATDKAPAAIGPYAQGNRLGNLIITSGSCPSTWRPEPCPRGLRLRRSAL